MQWSLIKSWAKDHGYDSFREKVEDGESDTQYHYYWSKIDDINITGMTTSISKLATEIYNHLTDNKFIEYQKEFKNKEAKEDIDHNEISGSW
jgi:hypothetical protein